MKKHRRTIRYLAVTVIIVRSARLWWFENSADSVVAALDATADEADDSVMAEELAKARQYNETLASVRVNLTDPFDESVMGEENEEYESLLCMTDDGIMGYIDIPSIDVNLPIYHGTSSTILEQGVGHLEGTSLPVGGTSTHTVLTGHTGLSSAKLFTDLDELENGDIFILSIFGEKLAYKVDQITVVEPDNLDDLYIVDGKDYCTLVTCTPYGINSHRLLVRGERTDYEEAVSDEEAMQPKEESSSWMREYRESLLISLTAFLVCLVLYLVIRKIRNRHDRNTKAQVERPDKSKECNNKDG